MHPPEFHSIACSGDSQSRGLELPTTEIMQTSDNAAEKPETHTYEGPREEAEGSISSH